MLPLKKRVNRKKCSFTTKQRMFGVFAIDKILRYWWTPFVGLRTLCHPELQSLSFCQLKSMHDIFPFSLLIWNSIYMCILSMLQSTGGVSIDRFDGGPDRLANSCKHPPSQHRLLYNLYSYENMKYRLANSRKYSSSFNANRFNCIFVLIQKIEVGKLFQKNPVSNQQHMAFCSIINFFLISISDEILKLESVPSG